ncbi:uncharacterized protein MELLADRAFT_104793 [Melampsora larici-populina 98AG31]|uniref:Uncharacterized protein n=1 Tax=Melampsora larici-populina (strain 98AG31 / pathotype 3-4-7) TaxID=747676 RepID=F4RFX4_MELLP|nr:uncharacterized protein MELLADRAFT_104793 [Melampsora larici-populina 98AG31]EGG08426.1 hypothetical protein MELLADRAFT_104793 [Melampsora larici-populina 98AG31]
MPMPSQFQDSPDQALRASISRISQLCYDLQNTFNFLSSLASRNEESTSVSPPPIPLHSRPVQTYLSTTAPSSSFGQISQPASEKRTFFNSPKANSNPEVSNNLAREDRIYRRPYSKSMPTILLHSSHVSDLSRTKTPSSPSHEIPASPASDTLESERDLQESNPPSIIIHDVAESERDLQESNPPSIIIHDVSIPTSSGHSDFNSIREGIDYFNYVETDEISELHLDKISDESNAIRDQASSSTSAIQSRPANIDSTPPSIPTVLSNFIFESPLASSLETQPGIIVNISHSKEDTFGRP